MTPKLTYDNDRFTFVGSYQDRLIPKQARFLWDKEAKVWYTRDPDRASRLSQYADSSCSTQLSQLRKVYTETLDASRAMDSTVEIPAPEGKTYLPFQKAGIAFALTRPSTLISDEMGCIDGEALITIVRKGQAYTMPLVQLYAKFNQPEGTGWDHRTPTLTRALKANGKMGLRRIRKVLFSGVKTCIKITTASGLRTDESPTLHHLVLTPDHQVAQPNNQWKAASDLQTNDPILVDDPIRARDKRVVYDPTIERIVTIAYGGPPVAVYDIVMDEPDRNFVVNGIIVHNCGKTIQAVGVINADPSIERVLIVAKASLKINWQRELESWLVRPMTVEIAMPDYWPVKADITIINFDILNRYVDQIRAHTWDLIVVDEAHNIKNKNTQRAISICGGVLMVRKKVLERTVVQSKALDPIPAKRKLFLTGTPIPNRVNELWPLLHYLDPQRWDDWFGFVSRYCAAHQSEYGRLDFSGASNCEELQHRLRSTIMVRRLKKDVLPELPPKVRQVLELPANGCTDLVSLENQIWDDQQALLEALTVAKELAKASDNPQDWRDAVEALKEAFRVAFKELSKVRHALGLAKVPYVLEHVRDILQEDPEKKLTLFCHHTDVVAAYMEAMGKDKVGAVRLTGADSQKARQVAVDKFQTDPKIRVFVGNIAAAGEGINLTAASHVVFAELDWTPARLFQAEDRSHRYGSDHESIFIQHLVLERSLDARIAKIVVAKQAIADRTLDTITDEGREYAEEPIILTSLPATTESTSRKQIESDAEKLTPIQIGAIHQGLRLLAGMCDGAHGRDDIGFNKLDTRIGKQLAECAVLSPRQAALGRRILLKYKRQVGVEVMDIIRPLPSKEKDETTTA